MMNQITSAHPWVAERKGKLRIAVQVFPLPNDPNPTESVFAAAAVAEEVGLDGFFIGDHPGIHIEPWLHLAHVAATTASVQLGSVVNCVFHRQPSMIGRMLADLDRISNGRAMLGLGIGWNGAEFGMLGLPFPPVPQRQDALDEAMTIINGMYRPEPISFSGTHWQVTDAHLTSPSVQQPRPPVMIAGAGKRTISQVAGWADIANFGNSKNTGNVTSTEGYVQKLDAFRAACAAIGRPPETLLLSHFTSWLMLSETNAAARAKLDGYFPNGLTEEQTRTRIWGDAAKITAYFQELAAIGFEYFVVQIQDSRDLESIRLLGEAVRPAITLG